MSSRKDQFAWPHQIRGREVQSRFGIRRSLKDKPAQQASILTYAQPGKGVSGESSN